MFDLRFDPDHRIFHIATHGLWTASVHAKFASALLAQGAYARMRHGPFAVLGDLTGQPVQAAELNGPSRLLQQQAMKLTSGPVALVVGSMLGKLQAERVLGGPRIRILLDREEAEAWLQRCWIDQGCVPSAAMPDHEAAG